MKNNAYRFLLLTLMGGLVTFTSCKKDDDPEPGANNNNSTSQAVIIDKDITTARTLDKVTPDGQTDYIVTADIDITADVVIKPGVIIVFKQGTDFWIKGDGSLNATGSNNSDSIYFKGEQDTKGYWGGLFFETDDVNNKLIFCSIKNAGAGDHTIPTQKGAVVVYDNARLKMQYSTVKKSGGYGIYLDGTELKLDEFKYNNFKESMSAPVFALVPIFKYLDGTTDYTGNTYNYIDVNSLAGTPAKTVSGSHIWQALNVPYRFPSHRVDVTGSIEVKPGASFIGQTNSGIRIQSGGSLKAIGTSTDSIYFRGEQQTAGYWGGFQFNSNSSLNEFQYVVVGDAGGVNDFVTPHRKANIEVNDVPFKISNSKIVNSGGVGIRTMNSGTVTGSNLSYSNNTDGNVKVGI